MRKATFPTRLPILLLAAAAASATPIRVSLDEGAPGGVGPLEFTFDPVEPPDAPYGFGDVYEFEGDYLFKDDLYRIHVEDFFQVRMDGWDGYGFNWHLETWPRDIGIYEQYCEVRFFQGHGETLILQGAWTGMWSEETPLFVTAESGGQRVDEQVRIAALKVETLPEPPAGALFAGGLLIAGIFSLFRQWRRSAYPKATRTSSTNARSKPSAPPGRAASTSTRPKARSASAISPPGSWSSARRIAAST